MVFRLSGDQGHGLETPPLRIILCHMSETVKPDVVSPIELYVSEGAMSCHHKAVEQLCSHRSISAAMQQPPILHPTKVRCCDVANRTDDIRGS